MKLDKLRQIESVNVFKERILAGSLSRTSLGARFTYENTFRQDCLRTGSYGVSFTLGPQRESYEISGVNLHTFFAGLLPEGLRLKALRQSLKTSEDDLFTLLLALGSNCIGDVYVRSDEEQESMPELEPESLNGASFFELFEKSIHSTDLKAREADPGIPGVIPKLSASMISFPVNLQKQSKQYILKLGTDDHPRLVQNEHFFMQMAKSCGLSVARTSVVFDRTNAPGLLVERFDRAHDKKEKIFRRLHQEDACQFLDRYPQDKYRLSLREIAEGIESLSGSPSIDVFKLLELYVFSYLIGNGDLHAKNISLVEDADSRIRFSPAYDLLSTLPYGDRKMALPLNGKLDNFYLKDFIEFGRIFELPEKSIRASVKKLTDRAAPWISRIEEIGLPQKKATDLQKTCLERSRRLASSL